MRSCSVLESKRPLQVWLAASVVGHGRGSDWRLHLRALIGQSMASNSYGSITFFPWSRPPYRLLQLPASALVKDPILRDRGDSLTLPSGSIGWLALSDFAHLLLLFS